MKLIIDEDLASRSLIASLGARLGDEAVHVLGKGSSDTDLWETAQSEGRAILTQNAKDFVPMAEATLGHAGLLLVSRHADRAKDLTIAQITDRVATIAGIYENLVDLMLVVNAFGPRLEADQ